MAWIYKFRIGLITALAIILIILAVAFSVLRAFLPHATGYVEEVQNALSDQTGLNFTIGSMDADMNWLTPRLILLDVSVLDKNDEKKELIYFDEVIFELAIFKSLLNAEPEITSVSLVGADILIERFANKNNPYGEWAVQGTRFSGDGSQGVSSELISALKKTDILLLDSDVRWIDHKNKKEPLDFVGVDLVSKVYLGKHSLGLELNLPEQYGEEFRIVVDVSDLNDINDIANAQLDIYLEGLSVNLERWLALSGLKDIPDITGFLDGKVWLTYRDHSFDRVIGDMSINALSISNSVSKRSWKAESVSAKFKAQNNKDNWRLDVTDLIMLNDGRLWDEASDIVVLGGNESGLNISSTYLRIQDVLPVSYVFLDDQTIASLKKFKLSGVSGDFYNIDLAITPSSDQPLREANGTFQNLKYSSSDNTIILDGMDGIFFYKDGQAKIELLTRFSEIKFSELFRQTLEINKLDGVIIANRTDSGWIVTSQNLYAMNNDVETDTRLSMIFESSGGINIDMQTDFKNARVKSIKKYYPVSIMSPDLVSWLDNGFLEGSIEAGSFALHGDLDKFPYNNNEGVMEVVFNSKKLKLHFLDGWPDIEELASDFCFYNTSFFMTNGTGITQKGVMRKVSARIPDLQKPRLFIDGEITAPADDIQQYVWNSGLDDILGATMRQFRAEGEANMNLFIEVPLDNPDTGVRSNGKLKFSGNTFYFPVMDYSLKDVSGDLVFSGQSISGEGLKASFEGKPLNIDIVGNENNPRKGSIFKLHGNLAIDGLLRKFSWIPQGWFEGESEWDIDIHLPGINDQYSIKIKMQSELDGVSFDISDVLSKKSNTRIPANITVKAIEDIVQVDLDMGAIARIFATRNDEALWNFFVESSLFKGRGDFVEDLNKDSTARMDIEYVDIPALFNNKKKEKGMDLKPTVFPSLDVNISTLAWGEWQFKNVHLETAWQPQGMLIKALNLQGPSLDVKGQGSWLNPGTGVHESDFKFLVNSPDLGNTLSSMGLTDSLRQGKHVATFDWHWMAEPYSFSLGKVNGSSHIELEEGQVKGVTPGTGGRLLGLLNVFKLHERLTSGFGDVYKEGFSFDSIKGDFEFNNGKAVTANTVLTAKSADAEILGTIGLVDKDYDLVVLVSPHSTAATAVAGTVVGGPVIGAGLVLLKKLFGVDEMLHEEYTITGPWEKPDVKHISENEKAGPGS